MSNWKNAINISEPWKQVAKGELPIQQLALFISKKLEAFSPYVSVDVEYERQDLVEAFEDASTNEELSREEFNYLMVDLYDWGDRSLGGIDKVCWIQTF